MIKGDRIIAKTDIEDINWKGRGLAEVGSKGTILGKTKGCYVIKWDSGVTTWKVLPESIDYSKSDREINKQDDHVIRREFWKTYEGIAKVNEETFEPGKKGDCFSNARKWAWEHDDGKTLVVHGKVTNGEGKTFDHAWVEHGNDVIDPTQGTQIEKGRWYELVKALPEAKYTPRQATVNIIRSGKLGPWYAHEVEDRYVWRKDKGENPNDSIDENVSTLFEEGLGKRYSKMTRKEEQEALQTVIIAMNNDGKGRLGKDFRKIAEVNNAMTEYVGKHNRYLRTDARYYEYTTYDGRKKFLVLRKRADGMSYGLFDKNEIDLPDGKNSIHVYPFQAWNKFFPITQLIKENTDPKFTQGDDDKSIDPPVSKKEEHEIVQYILKKYEPEYLNSSYPHNAEELRKSFKKIHVYPDGAIVYSAIINGGECHYTISRHRIGVGFTIQDYVYYRFWPWEPVIHSVHSKFGFQQKPPIKESEELKSYVPITRRDEHEALSTLFRRLPIFKKDPSVKNRLQKTHHRKMIDAPDYYIDEIAYKIDFSGTYHYIYLQKLKEGMIFRLSSYDYCESDKDPYKAQSWDWVNPENAQHKRDIFESINNPYSITPKEEKQVVDVYFKNISKERPTYNHSQSIKKIRHDKLPNGGDEIEYGGMVSGTFNGLTIAPFWEGFIIRKLHRTLQRGSLSGGAMTRAPDDPNGPPTIGYAITQKPNEGHKFGNESYKWFRPFDDKNIRGEMDEVESHGDVLNKTGYWRRKGAGAIILAKNTGRILLPYRSVSVEQPHTWGVWGGAIEEGEDPASAVRREIMEEMGGNITITELIPLYVFQDPKVGFQFHNFLAVVPTEFTPKLDWETEKADWVKYGVWPRPMHFGLRILLDRSDEVIKSEIKKYMKDPTLIKTQKMDQLRFKAAHDMIRQTWWSMQREGMIHNPRDRFDYDDVSTWLLNEEPLQNLLDVYGHQFYPFDNEPSYTFLHNDVERVLEELELRYNRRISRYIDPTDPLYVLKKLVKGKSWERAKYDLAKFTLSGPLVPERERIEDESADAMFRRIYLNAMGETFYNASMFGNIPRLDTLEMPNKDAHINNFLRYYLPRGTRKFPAKVKVYRGTNSPHSKIRPGDFCSFDKDFARYYIRGKYGAVVHDVVPSHDLLVYKVDPNLSEFIYWPEGHKIQKYSGEIPKFKEFYLQNR